MRAAIVAGACAVLLSPDLRARTTTTPRATLVGVVGSDSALTFLAVFDGHDWWNAWPWAARE
jgi:hypothetical protein